MNETDIAKKSRDAMWSNDIAVQDLGMDVAVDAQGVGRGLKQCLLGAVAGAAAQAQVEDGVEFGNLAIHPMGFVVALAADAAVAFDVVVVKADELGAGQQHGANEQV